MEITPRTFMDADNYHIYENRIARQCIVPQPYGLLPQNTFELQYTIQGNKLVIGKISCVVLDINGVTLQLNRGVEIALPHTTQGIFYLIVSSGGDECVEENGVPYRVNPPRFNIINLLDNSKPSSLPLMKLQVNHGDWEVVDFIPPCCAVQAHPLLVQLAKQCKQALNKILSLARQQGYNEVYYELGGLLVELTNTLRGDTPIAFLTRLKKAIFILNAHNLLEKAGFEEVDDFVWGEYNPHTILETIQRALAYFTIVIDFLTRPVEAPAPVVEKEKPKEEDEEITYML